MVDAVLLVLREVLEAALLVCLLLSLSYKLKFGWRWSLVAFLIGFSGSWLSAAYAYPIADGFDGMGQELLNSGLYIVTILSALVLILLILRQYVESRDNFFDANLGYGQIDILMPCLCIIIVSCSIVREGSEIWIYLSSFAGQSNTLYSALVGTAIGIGIGLSLGSITYYCFIFMPEKFFLPVFLTVMTLLSGGFSMQIAEQLMQVGLLESTEPLWDSSFLVSEKSWGGEMLYALLGYDAKPTLTQGIFYIVAIFPVLMALFWYGYRHWVKAND